MVTFGEDDLLIAVKERVGKREIFTGEKLDYVMEAFSEKLKNVYQGEGDIGLTMGEVATTDDLPDQGEEALQDKGESEIEEGYVISTPRPNRLPCLHKVRGCWRARTMRFMHFEVRDELPADNGGGGFHYCRNCWPKQSVSSSSSSDTGSSSTPSES